MSTPTDRTRSREPGSRVAEFDADSRRIATEFREQGFAHVPGLLTGPEVARFRAAALAAIKQRSRKDKDFGTGIVATTDAWEHHPALRELALHPRIGALAEHVAGMPLRVWGGEVLVKHPHETAATGLHDDLTFALLDSRLTFNTWIALDDVPTERGCLTFLPRSHARGGPERVDLAEQYRDPDGYLIRHWPELQWTPRVTVPLRAGDATLHHSRTAHAAGANTTDTTRVSFLLTFTDADATYRPLPGHDPLDLEAGQALPDRRYPRVIR
ncbi:phytanoyl-CoA dioxygenase family protein [Amycolatopsis anabasis]|uniref:phytanoyl-CoA dioxygenase family protein n=1 Tax=Amycolatopsis anabasis TaxID=1840409 RepID=UPI00131E2AEB|nr:phytanoyl-CoA dioxygenase family protein [Amycolatopsis anabasis]